MARWQQRINKMREGKKHRLESFSSPELKDVFIAILYGVLHTPARAVSADPHNPCLGYATGVTTDVDSVKLHCDPVCAA